MGIHKARLERWQRYREYKAEGHSMKEVAEHFGISEATAVAACKGIAPQKPRPGVDFAAKNQYTSGFDREANARRYIAKRTPGFEYAGNFTGVDGYVDLRCKKCGAVIRKSFVSVRHGSASCDNCKAIEIEAKRQEREVERAERESAKAELRRRRKVERETERFMRTVLIQCEECGKIFATTQESRVCCSPECTRHRANRRHDKRITREKRIDKDISVPGLYERDGGVCWICGGMCDMDDKAEKDGTIVCGKNYPSIDHIVPVCEGGADAWDNVKLAHRGCNLRRYLDTKRPRLKI